jgi:hypothetical protein
MKFTEKHIPALIAELEDEKVMLTDITKDISEYRHQDDKARLSCEVDQMLAVKKIETIRTLLQKFDIYL